ncbi:MULTISPECIES: VENN motif pre-toxin domain-containing protein [Leclercia]|uniref:VENN motif pre-toxin domain-containing protein n=1 Tax=Leclercia TaxID=83654 RepID=UPI001F45FA50|nr:MULTISPECIES: VENN motif pre-toxin domain-containing protein [Leclercia]
MAEVIGHRSGLEDGMEKAAAHAVANAALAAMQGQSALAGAAGAVAGELAGSIAKEMYGKEVAELSESQKQTISSLATIAAGIAGGLAGDGTAAAVAGAQGGKTVVENNSLAHVLAAIEANKPGTVDSWTKEQQEQIREACSGNPPVSCETVVTAIGCASSAGSTRRKLSTTLRASRQYEKDAAYASYIEAHSNRCIRICEPLSRF